MLNIEQKIFLCGTALVTSIISGAIGMAGGMALINIMVLYLPPTIAIPIHGVIQLVSNTSRTVLHNRHIQWWVVCPFLIMLLPAGYFGIKVALKMPDHLLLLIISLYVIVTIWLPKLILRNDIIERYPKRTLLFLGALGGFLNVIVGSIGLLIAQFLLRFNFSRYGLVSTKATMQVFGHLAKIVLYGIAGFVYKEYLVLISIMCMLVILGNWIGSRILSRINERMFVAFFKGALTILAIRHIYVSILRLF